MTTKHNAIKIIGFCCRNAISREKQLAEDGWLSYEPTIKIVRIPCSSKVDTLPIIKAFEAGADGIFVLECMESNCHLLDGNLRAEKVINYTKGLLDEIGIERSRLEIYQLGTPEWENFDQIAQDMTEKIKTLGKSS